MIVNEEKMIAKLNESMDNTLMELLDMKFESVNPEKGEVVMSMPVNAKVHQPMGLLHGGATAALAESVGSASSMIYLDPENQGAVGISLSCNHVRSIREGRVFARAKLTHKGRSTHLWEIKIEDEAGKLISDCRLTNMIIEIKKDKK